VKPAAEAVGSAVGGAAVSPVDGIATVGSGSVAGGDVLSAAGGGTVAAGTPQAEKNKVSKRRREIDLFISGFLFLHSHN
jgi:hypothetical protein